MASIVTLSLPQPPLIVISSRLTFLVTGHCPHGGCLRDVRARKERERRYLSAYGAVTDSPRITAGFRFLCLVGRQIAYFFPLLNTFVHK